MSKLSTNQIREQRITTLFEWLYIFKFTDYDFAFLLTGQKPNGGYRFIRRLIKEGFLVRFNNLYLGKQINLIALTSKGVNYLTAHSLLKAYGRPNDKLDFTRLKQLKSSISLIHNLLVQKATYIMISDKSLIGNYTIELEWEKKVGDIRVDVLIRIGKKKVKTYDEKVYQYVALELERTEKSKKRTDYLFKQHDINLINRRYHQVIYAFDDRILLETYIKRFDGDWNDYKMLTNSKTNKKYLSKAIEHYEPQCKENFDFALLTRDSSKLLNWREKS